MFFSWSCNPSDESTTDQGPVFHSVAATQSGLTFSNQVLENDTLNYFSFPYLYMGGGVAVGDIDNDGLADVYMTGNMEPNKLYLNKGGLKFEDISVAAGVSGDKRWYTGVCMLDANQDGWLDIYVCVSGKYGPFENQLFINNQDRTFTERAAEYGLADTSTSIQAVSFDYDGDGLQDLFVANYPQVPVSMGNEYYYQKMRDNKYSESAHLYKNMGNGSFDDVTQTAGVQNFGLSLGVVAADFNEDNLIDLYVSNDFNVPDYFYLNQGDGTFGERLSSSFRHTSMFGMGLDAVDFNNDGHIDLGQVDMTPADHKRAKTNMASMSPETFWQGIELGFHYQYMQNSLQLNRGNNAAGLPQFSDISRFTGMATTDWSWGIQFADLDNDGWQDVFISNGMKRDVNNNDANVQFKEGNFFKEYKPDYKLLPSEPIHNYLFQNQGGINFLDVGEAWGLDSKGFSNGFAFGDLDNDGDLDLLVNNLDEPMSLFENLSEQNGNNYLQLSFKGPEQNPFGLGVKVFLHTQAGIQKQELSLSRGFQSSVAPKMHFGLGMTEVIDKLEILWPDGKYQSIEQLTGNQNLQINYSEATNREQAPPSIKPFKIVSQDAKLDFQHIEDQYDDFLKEPLLPHKNSAYGPAVSVGDINEDGFDDFFIGNATNAKARMYLQNPNGAFSLLPGPWEADSMYEDLGSLLEDLDGDGDVDLILTSGDNNPSRKKYHHLRIYLNTPEGFIRNDQALPKLNLSGQEISVQDFDNDGDLDLFVGGRLRPAQYPLPASSYLLRNDGGVDGQLTFSDVTASLIPSLKEVGLVTSSLWADFNGDQRPDLIIAGEWMPIRYFQNKGTFFEEVSLNGLKNSEAWWYSLEALDVDQDGDLDFIAGNLGLNYKYRASDKSPFELYANDFDENGSLDIVLSYQKKGELLPVRGRECSSQQVPALATRFETYQAFANADLPELYGEHMLENALHLEAKDFSSAWFENRGEAGFVRHNLPSMAQLSSINAIEVFDYNEDEYPDLMLFGNLYGSEVETPRNDAGLGLVLQGGPQGQWTAIPASESGLLISGDVKQTARMKWGPSQKEAFLIGRNNESLQLVLFQR